MEHIRETLKRGKEKLASLTSVEESPKQAALREACDAYIVRACAAIRQDMERERAEGRVCWDAPNGADSPEGRGVNPHYLVHWRVRFDVDFKKRETFYEIEPEENILRFGFAIPVFYILEGMEKSLAQDGIVPVHSRAKRAGLFHKSAKTETVKVRLHRPEICNGLEAASRDYSAGFTAPHMEFETGSDFAYFLADDYKEGK